jgi:hypothetical protein
MQIPLPYYPSIKSCIIYFFITYIKILAKIELFTQIISTPDLKLKTEIIELFDKETPIPMEALEAYTTHYPGELLWVKIKAKYIHGEESDWSESLPLIIPQSKDVSIVPAVTSFLEKRPPCFSLVRRILSQE